MGYGGEGEYGVYQDRVEPTWQALTTARSLHGTPNSVEMRSARLREPSNRNCLVNSSILPSTWRRIKKIKS